MGVLMAVSENRATTLAGIALLVLSACGCYVVPGISGRVVDQDTGEPIPGALVLVYYQGSQVSLDGYGITYAKRRLRTDENGRFRTGSALAVPHVPFVRFFDHVAVSTRHPHYLPERVYGETVFLDRDGLSRQHLNGLELRRVRLDRFFAEPRYFAAPKDGADRRCLAYYREYFAPGMKPDLPITLEQARAWWCENLLCRFPEHAEAIRRVLPLLDHPPR